VLHFPYQPVHPVLQSRCAKLTVGCVRLKGLLLLGSLSPLTDNAVHFLFLARRSPPLHTLEIEGDVREDEILESLRLTPSLKHLNPDSINSGRVADVFFCAPARNNGSNMSKDEVLPKLETLGLRASKNSK